MAKLNLLNTIINDDPGFEISINDRLDYIIGDVDKLRQAIKENDLKSIRYFMGDLLDDVGWLNEEYHLITAPLIKRPTKSKIVKLKSN